MKVFKWILVVCLLALLALGVVVMLVLASSEPSLKQGTLLTVDLSRTVVERPRDPGLQGLVSGVETHPLAAHEIAAALHAAAQDPKIAGVLLHGAVSGSSATLIAVRDALGAVRAAHKPVVAYYGSMDERGLWFASAADEIWMEPLGVVLIDGFAIEIPYFGQLCEKYGIEVQVTRVGKYKSAVEPFMLDTMSSENREQLSAILTDIQNALFDDIASARKLERSELDKAATQEGIVSAQNALSRGWITRIGSFGEVLTDWKQRLKVDEADPLEQMDIYHYARRQDADAGDGRGIAVIEAEGEIVDGSSAEGIGGDDLARELRAARLDPDTAAVVLRVNSPGGSATASDVIRSEVRALRQAGKPVVVSMGAVAASGGYWISADAEVIVAHPATVTGSIGVFGMLPNVERFAREHGVRTEVVSTSPLAGWESMLRRKEPAQLARMQLFVDQIYDRFLDLVAEGRKLDRTKVAEIAQGRVWSGRAARELGLVDELGDLDRAIALAREKARLDAQAPVRRTSQEKDAFDQFIEEVLEGEPTPLTQGWVPQRTELEQVERWLRQLTGRSGVLARLPFDLEVR